MTQPHRILCEGFQTLVRGRHGLTVFNKNDVYIGRSLDLYGEYSEGEVELFDQLVRAGDVVVEAGANIGAHTLPLAKRAGRDGRVYAFEPQRMIFQTLCANMALNCLTNVECHQAACGAEMGEIVVPALDFSAVNNFGGVSLGHHTHGERVPVVTIDSLNLPACRLIKADVEGMELQVLQGARETIARFRPALYVENDRADRSPALIAHLLSAGYQLFWHLPPLYRPGNFFQNIENAFANIVSVNVLCLEPGAALPAADLRPVDGPQSRWQDTSPRATRRRSTDPPGDAGLPPAANPPAERGRMAATRDIPPASRPSEPASADALMLRASQAIANKRYDLAIEALQPLTRLQPEDPAIQCNLGSAHGCLGQHEQALGYFRRALELRPDYAEAHWNLGNALRELGVLDEAVESCRQGLRLQANAARGHLLLANALADLARFEEAQTHYERALSLQPDFALAHKNLGILLLRRGEFARGWREYEWHWQADGATPPGIRHGRPCWGGQPLAGKTILLYGEQGLGDQIQFARFVRLFPGQAVLQVDERIVRLLKQVNGGGRVIGFKQTPPRCDVHAPLMSLPRILHTTLETIPPATPYLEAEPEKVEYWRQRLGSLSGFRVGLFWQGNAAQSSDRFRSFPLQVLEPLAHIPGVQLVNLQKGAGQEQVAQVPWGHRIADYSEEMDRGEDAFVDTAAVIRNLDLVVTCDSSLAHLAGALGHPAWTLLRFVPDWRWLMQRTDSPWYPSLRLFRQPRVHDWPGLVSVVADELQRLVSATTNA